MTSVQRLAITPPLMPMDARYPADMFTSVSFERSNIFDSLNDDSTHRGLALGVLVHSCCTVLHCFPGPTSRAGWKARARTFGKPRNFRRLVSGRRRLMERPVEVSWIEEGVAVHHKKQIGKLESSYEGTRNRKEMGEVQAVGGTLGVELCPAARPPARVLQHPSEELCERGCGETGG